MTVDPRLAPTGGSAASPLLELDALSCRFGGLVALDQVSFAVQQGEIFGLIGPNGAGKTTLFNLISGLTPVSGGQVRWRGEPIGGLGPERINRLGIARTFQNLRLYISGVFYLLKIVEIILAKLFHLQISLVCIRVYE